MARGSNGYKWNTMALQCGSWHHRYLNVTRHVMLDPVELYDAYTCIQLVNSLLLNLYRPECSKRHIVRITRLFCSLLPSPGSKDGVQCWTLLIVDENFNWLTLGNKAKSYLPTYNQKDFLPSVILFIQQLPLTKCFRYIFNQSETFSDIQSPLIKQLTHFSASRGQQGFVKCPGDTTWGLCISRNACFEKHAHFLETAPRSGGYQCHLAGL